MRLRHGGLGAVVDVVAQLLAVADLRRRAVDVLHAVAIDQEQVVLAWPAGDIDIFAQFDGAFGADQEQAAVAPGGQLVGREPVDADIAGGTVGGQHHLAEVLQFGRVGIVEIGDLARYHFCLGAAGEEQELLDLMRADVAQDAAVAGLLIEPVRPLVVADAVRSETDGRDNAADGAGLDQVGGGDGRRLRVVLGIADREDAAGLGLGAAQPVSWYYISVDDDNTSGTFSLCLQGNPLDADITGTNVSCFGNNDGTVTITPQGGTGMGYTYAWTKDGSPAAINTPSASALGPGVYAIKITDIGDASFIVRSFTVNENPALGVALFVVNESCSGSANGSVSATPSGGTGSAYLYNWYRNGTSMGLTTSSINGLNTAWYRVVVTDAGALGCTVTDSVEVGVDGLMSSDPDSIIIANNNICQGTPKILTVSGGSLGTGAAWKWYLDGAFTTSAGTDGIALTVDPSVNTTYWVRAEGACNTSGGVSATVLTGVPSTAPTSASVDRNDLCPADGNIVLSYAGGTLGDGATAEWYSDATFTTNVGNGNALTLATPGCNHDLLRPLRRRLQQHCCPECDVKYKDSQHCPNLSHVDRNDLCPADGNIVLSYAGGTLGDGATARMVLGCCLYNQCWQWQ